MGGGHGPHRGAVDPQGSYVLKILNVKMKESGPVGGHTPGAPPRSTNGGYSFTWGICLTVLKMWLSPVMFHYGLCHMNIQEVPRVLPNLLKGWGVYYHVYVIGAHKRTHVYHQNMPNHCTSIYHEWMCVCVWQQWGWLLLGILYKMWCGPVYMLPRELIWERVAPSHTGVTQNGGWP